MRWIPNKYGIFTCIVLLSVISVRSSPAFVEASEFKNETFVQAAPVISEKKTETKQTPLKSYSYKSRRKKKKLRISGSLTSEYIYDTLVSPSPRTVTHESVGEYLNLRLRKKDVNDLRFVFSGWFVKEFSNRKRERSRISKLYGELNHSSLHTNIRLGRQSASGNTLFTHFDGLSVSYFVDPTVSLNIGGGKLYYTTELDESFTTREALGLNSYWTKQQLTMTAIVDYDLDFSQFNNLFLGGELSRKKTRYNASLEFRKNPFLDYRTALFEPAISGVITSLEILQEANSREGIKALAEKNTSDSLDFNLGTTIDFSRIWRGNFRFSHTISEVLIFNNGSETKRSNRISVLFTERNALSLSEVWTLLLMHQPASDYETNSITSTFSKFWSSGAGGILRFRWERSKFSTAGSTLKRMVPGFSLLYYGDGAFSATLDAEYAIEKSNSAPDALHSIRTRASITYSF